MSEYEVQSLALLKAIHDELVTFREERQQAHREKEEWRDKFRKQLAAEKEARRKEHEAYLATVQSCPCEAPQLSSH